jgi:serine/threonine-protein kinase
MERFEIIQLLGEGGFGKTYLAEVKDEELRREWGEYVAIKIPLDREREEVLVSELVTNATLHLKLKGVRAENIVAYLGFSQYKGHYCMVAEYIDGVSLRERMGPVGRQKPLPIEEALFVTESVLCGLVSAHRMGILHRDIKPSNILIAKDGKVKITDFGVAEFISSKEMCFSRTGTYCYMPKESIKKERETWSSDTYSVGVTLYEMVTGKLPFTGQTAGEIMKNILEQEPAPPIFLNPDVGETLNSIILFSIAKDQSKRFQTAEEFLNVIRSYKQKDDTYIDKKMWREEQKKTEKKPPPKMFVPIGEWDMYTRN